MLKVTYYNRDKRPGNFSIEELFASIRSALKERIDMSDYYYNPALGRLKSVFDAKKYQSDINHITGDVNFLALKLNSDKTIITVHDLGYYENLLKGNNKLKRFFYEKIWLELPFKRATMITTVSHYTKSKIIKYFHIPENKIKVIYNPVNESFVPGKRVFNAVEPRILAIGTGEHKNYKRLIEAVKGISCTLVFIGKLNKELLTLLTEYKVKHENYFNVDQSRVVELYQTSDLLYFASLHEGFGMPIVEANATGIPVVTSNLASMPEVAADAAYIVDPYNTQEIRNAIISIVNNPTLRNELTAKGFENKERFKLSVLSSAYLSLYHQVAAK